MKHLFQGLYDIHSDGPTFIQKYCKHCIIACSRFTDVRSQGLCCIAAVLCFVMVVYYHAVCTIFLLSQSVMQIFVFLGAVVVMCSCCVLREVV